MSLRMAVKTVTNTFTYVIANVKKAAWSSSKEVTC